LPRQSLRLPSPLFALGSALEAVRFPGVHDVKMRPPKLSLPARPPQHRHRLIRIVDPHYDARMIAAQRCVDVPDPLHE